MSSFYNSVSLFYRGRKIRLVTEDGIYHRAEVSIGKPLEITKRDWKRIRLLADRKVDVQQELEKQGNGYAF